MKIKKLTKGIYSGTDDMGKTFKLWKVVASSNRKQIGMWNLDYSNDELRDSFPTKREAIQFINIRELRFFGMIQD